jgi:MADS-box transcription factor
MGRCKIELKRIEKSSNRLVTYSKRKNGIIKKAKEVSVLCDAQVSLILSSESGKIHEYISPSTTLIDVLDKYQRASGKQLWNAEHESLSNEIDRIKKENEKLELELRHLKGENIALLNFNELIALEDALENGLTGVRGKMMEMHGMVKRNVEILEEENKELNLLLQQHMAVEDVGNKHDASDHK